jgi:hypothetical protein
MLPTNRDINSTMLMATEIYYYTARDAFRTDWSRRADFAASYSRPLGRDHARSKDSSRRRS